MKTLVENQHGKKVILRRASEEVCFRYLFVKALLQKSFTGASAVPLPYVLGSILAVSLSASNCATSGLSIFFITLSACHFLKLKSTPSSATD